jgi:hypothetical protein
MHLQAGERCIDGCYVSDLACSVSFNGSRARVCARCGVRRDACFNKDLIDSHFVSGCLTALLKVRLTFQACPAT